MVPPRTPPEISTAMQAVPAKQRAGLRASLLAQCDGDWARVVVDKQGAFTVYNNAAKAEKARGRALEPVAVAPVKKAAARKAPAKKSTARKKASATGPPVTPKVVALKATPPPKRKPWTFVPHALERIEDRLLTQEEVLGILDNPEKMVAGRGDAAIYHGNGLRVVVNDKDRRVITVTYESSAFNPPSNVVVDLTKVKPVQTIQPGLFVEYDTRTPRMREAITLPTTDDPSFDWKSVEGLDKSAAKAVERFAGGIPKAIPVAVYRDVANMYHITEGSIEGAVRAPDRVVINAETARKGYTLLDMTRGDTRAVVGFLDPQNPMVLAVYHTVLLANDTHRVNVMGGGGAKKRAAAVSDAASLVKAIRKAGAEVSDGDKTATVTYQGKELKGLIPVAPTTNRRTAEDAWRRVQQQIAAIDRRERETAGKA